ncbi:hypothetical protein QTG56_24960 (plasmid) [Rossellomorea sp. AcN35-11]|nr:hypothetical protein QTG56_24960 [Rossellomorea sp. AcN35-11]
MNGRHYIMQRVLENAGLNNITVPDMVFALIEKKDKLGEKVSDEDLLQLHPLILDYMTKYFKSPEHFFRAYHKVRKYAAWKPRRKPQVLVFSELGRQFEDLVGVILEESKIEFTKYACGIKGCEPDFIIDQTHWIDAKLSEHTVFNSETIEKYEPHIDKLTIIYLRRSSGRAHRRMITPKTELVHISEYLSVLSEEKQLYYSEILDKIEKKAIRNLR